MSLKHTGELCVMTMKNNPKFETELACQFKIDMRNLTNFAPSTLKHLHFNRLLFTKLYIMFELRKYRGVMFDGTEY